MRVKILVIAGVNDRTVDEQVDIESGCTLLDLLKIIKEKYSINLFDHTQYIIMLDGSVINMNDHLDKKIGENKEFTVIPSISGG